MSAIAPSSRKLARAMTAHLHGGAERVVEFGPGTGRITDMILSRHVRPENLTLFELDAEMAEYLEARLPKGVTVHRRPAQEAVLCVQPGVDSVISGLPLLSMPEPLRLGIVRAAFDILSPNGCFVQFSYGMRPPVTPMQLADLDIDVTVGPMVLGNLPPARVFIYRRIGTRHGVPN